MIAKLTVNNKNYKVNLAKPLDISIPLTADKNNPIAWYLNPPIIEPVTADNWIGSVAKGSSTNFNNIQFNPHAHGTHTECLGHITKDFYSINQILKQFFFIAEVITITPKQVDGDFIITKDQLEDQLQINHQEAVIIRTLPNAEIKKHTNYSHTNPPFLDVEATKYLVENGIKHLLVDLPSVDKEVDGGKLESHKAFWKINDVNHINKDSRLDCTITEFIYVSEEIANGTYLLNLQIASFENDATPSKPLLYSLENL